MIIADTETCWFVVRRFFKDPVISPVDVRIFQFDPDSRDPSVQRGTVLNAAMKLLLRHRTETVGSQHYLIEVSHRERRVA